MENSPRVLAGDNAPDLIRLPSISDLVVDGCSRIWTATSPISAGTKVPRHRSSCSCASTIPGRPRGEGSLYAMGLNYPDRRVLQQ